MGEMGVVGERLQEKCILVLENEALTFKPYRDALDNAGIRVSFHEDTDDFLDELNSVNASTIGCISLDLKIDAPLRAKADKGKYGGRWIYQEVLKNIGTDFIEDRYKSYELASKQVAFVTAFPNDAELTRLKSRYEDRGTKVPVFSKKGDSISSYVDWARTAINQANTVDEYHNAGFLACRMCEALDLDQVQIVNALGGSAIAQIELTNRGEKVEDLWGALIEHYPPEKCFAAQSSIERWGIISKVIADSISIYNNDISKAKIDLELGISDFEGKSALDIIVSGGHAEVIDLEYFLEQRWGRL